MEDGEDKVITDSVDARRNTARNIVDVAVMTTVDARADALAVQDLVLAQDLVQEIAAGG